MKKGVIVLVVLVAVLAAAPFGFSFWAESRLNSMLDDLNEAAVVDFTLIRMDRGWFSSEAIIEAEMAPSLSQKVSKLQQGQGAALMPGMVLKNTIYHGPFPFMSGSFSGLPVIASVDTKFVKSMEGEEPLLDFDYSMVTDFSMSGKNHVSMDIPEWDGAVDGGKATMQWKGLNGDISFSSGLQDAKMNIAAPYLKIQGKDGSMLLESLKVDSESEVGIEGLSLGSATFTIGKIAVQDSKSNVDFIIDDLGMTADTTATGDNINSTARFTIAAFTLAGERFGPGAFSLAFRNLDAGAVARISNKYKEISTQGDMPPEQVNMMLGTTLLAEMSTLLQKGPEIEIGELSLAAASGKLIGTARLTVDTSQPEMLNNPLTIKDTIIGEVDVEIPEDLLVALNVAAIRQEFMSVKIEYTEEQLQTMAKNRVSKRFAPLVGANIFTHVGNMYKFSASFKDGVPVVNGQPFQIPMGGSTPPGRELFFYSLNSSGGMYAEFPDYS
jgi:uncharacterized protein YdgA (DUF945 family)